MAVNTYIVQSWIGDAVEELDGFDTLEYVYDGCGELVLFTYKYVPRFGFLTKVGAHFDNRCIRVEHLVTCSSSSPYFDESLGIEHVTLPAIARG